MSCIAAGARPHRLSIPAFIGLGLISLLLPACGGGPQVQNAASGGGTTGTVTVPPPPITVTVSPASTSVTPGGQLSLAATVTGGQNNAVTWQVNGVPGGNATVGTITGSGQYLAPTVIPNPSTVIITAVSVADPTKSASATVVIAAPSNTVTVNVSPATASLQAGAVIAFTTVVQGAANTAVTWAVNGIVGGSASLGMITAAGVYTAPAAIPTNPVVAITATSVADPTAVGTSQVTVTQTVTVSVSPPLASVEVSLMQQFGAAVTGTTNQAVTWRVNGIVGGNATAGTIDVNGVYTAPVNVPANNVVSISAVSQASPSSQGFATVTIITAQSQSVVVSVTPLSSSLNINLTQVYVASVTGLFRNLPPSNQVNWHANGLPGGNAQSGTIVPLPPGDPRCPPPTPTTSCGLYTAPAAVPFPNTVVITAFSVTDPSSFGNATVLITAPSVVTVSILPTTAAVAINGTEQFNATVTGTANQNVTWSVDGNLGGNAAVGTITSTGLYTAPGAIGAHVVAATSVVATGSSAAATVNVLAAPPPPTVSVTPGTASVRVSNQIQMAATISGGGSQTVTWQVNGVNGGTAATGFIDANGLYTAPAGVPPGGTVTITAVGVAPPNPSGAATLTILPQTSISMNPTSATVNVSQGVQFFVTVTGVASPNVVFAVNGIAGGNSSVGTITSGGLYVAPASPPAGGPVSVTATETTSVPQLVASATVTIQVPITVSVAPATANLALGGMQTFAPTVTGTATQTVNWLVNGIPGGNNTVGTINAGGVYTAPSNLLLTQSFTISAQSTVDTTAVGNAQVTVNVPVAVTISPTTATVNTGGIQQFNASVTGAANTAVTWTTTGGSITTSGRLTAPATGGTVTVTATSVADPTKSASATVTVNAGVSVVVNPATASVVVSGTVNLSATVTNATPNTVAWSVTGGAPNGTVNPASGTSTTYTAPAVVPGGPVTIVATSQDGSNTTDTATLTVLPPASVVINPPTAALLVNQQLQFSAVVTGMTNPSLSWSVTGGGTINSNGVYTAPSTPAAAVVITVTASTTNPAVSVSNTANVSVTAPPAGVFVSVFPRNRNLPIGKSQQFTAHVIRSADQSVNWSVNGIPGGNTTVGTIDAAGLYAPPNTQPANPNITVTACSVSTPAACMTVNSRIVPDVRVTPASAKLSSASPNTLQLNATVNGVANSAVTWAVAGGINFGSINSSGLYTRPGQIAPGLVEITATSVADPLAVGYATINVTTFLVDIAPNSPIVMPGGRIQFHYQTHLYPLTTPSSGPLVTWSASAGAITQNGLFTAPTTTGNVTVTATSTVDSSRSDSTTVTVVSLGSSPSPVLAVDTLTKMRPYDVVRVSQPPCVVGSAPPAPPPFPQTCLTVKTPQSLYASWQIAVESRNEDLSGVNVFVSDFADANGNVLPASNAVIYLEKMVNAVYPSRVTEDIGEYPDPLIPKVDPFTGETRNAFPFSVNRISPAYRAYPRVAGETTNSNFGAGRAVSGGTYSGTSFKHFVMNIQQTGPVGTATFRWSNDGGATFAASNVVTSTSPITLSDGVTVRFTAGGVTGVPDFVAGNSHWVFAGPSRTQPVWIDFYVPSGTPSGSYLGTVRVVRSGKPDQFLPIVLDVTQTVMTTSSIVPSYFGMNWASLQAAHFGNTIGPQMLGLGQLYGVACLINRISCDTASVFAPAFTFSGVDGTVVTSNYNAYDQATAPLANGSITPHGEQLTAIRLPRAGGTVSEQYFATENMLSALNLRGWRSRAFDFSFDEPATANDFRAAMSRSSLVRSADPALRTLVTTDISQFNSNLLGYVNRWTPNFSTLESKEYLDGPNGNSKAFYGGALAGDEVWWYPSCKTHDCAGTGSSTRFDGYQMLAIDSTAVANRSWGVMAVSPYEVTGLLYQDTVLAYSRFFGMSQPKIDVWESTYYQGGNGEGTLFYPGRPGTCADCIGGASHIPIESLRLKHIRNALVDQELGALQIAAGNELGFDSAMRNGLYINLYSANLNGQEILTRTEPFMGNVAGTQAGGFLQAVTVPPIGGYYIDPATANRVWRVTGPPGEPGSGQPGAAVCPGGGQHYYSYWPIYNQSGSHLIIRCVGNPSVAQLLRDDTRTPACTALAPNTVPAQSCFFVVNANVLASVPGGIDPLRVFWSPTDPNRFYGAGNGAQGGQIIEWNPFTNTGGAVANVRNQVIAGQPVTGSILAYVSFDARYFLMELRNANNTFAVGVFDRQTNSIIGTFDPAQFSFYDESVFSKDNGVWVNAIDFANNSHGFKYTNNLASRIRVIEAHHHSHGLLPNGIPAGAMAGSNRNCPAGSPAGIPGSGWKPTGVVVNETIDTTGAVQNLDPLASVMIKFGCAIPGQHQFGHFSWNNTHTDRFFVSTESYSPPGTDPLAQAVVMVRMRFNGAGFPILDQVDVVANHRSEQRFGYYALPRVSCNQQAERCIFASSMTMLTNKTTAGIDLYVVEVPSLPPL